MRVVLVGVSYHGRRERLGHNQGVGGDQSMVHKLLHHRGHANQGHGRSSERAIDVVLPFLLGRGTRTGVRIPTEVRRWSASRKIGEQAFSVEASVRCLVLCCWLYMNLEALEAGGGLQCSCTADCPGACDAPLQHRPMNGARHLYRPFRHCSRTGCETAVAGHSEHLLFWLM